MAKEGTDERWDVFLSHNSADKPFVEKLARRLAADGYRVWFDTKTLQPGQPWQEGLERGVERSRHCVVCVGPGGFGRWHAEEMRQAEALAVEGEGFALLPVLLPGVDDTLKATLPAALKRRTWVVFDADDDREAYARLREGLDGHVLDGGSTKAPAWATAAGEDDFGTWARLEVAGASVKMRRILAGTFWMGSPEDEPGRSTDEGPRREVRLSDPFWLAEVPVTQALWKAVIGRNPSRFEGFDHPVEQISWDDAQRFLTKVEGLAAGLDAGLPTEAQWEYACRAGTLGARYGELDVVAWHLDSADGQTERVGRRAPNPWGLCDMLGNVWEWCADRYGRYEAGAVVDPVGAAAGRQRVLRGGAWAYGRDDCRAARRSRHGEGHRSSSVGFRLSARGNG